MSQRSNRCVHHDSFQTVDGSVLTWKKFSENNIFMEMLFKFLNTFSWEECKKRLLLLRLSIRKKTTFGGCFSTKELVSVTLKTDSCMSYQSVPGNNPVRFHRISIHDGFDLFVKLFQFVLNCRDTQGFL
ncbi:MAG: hypothetical protein IPJ66_18025 [Bacteroidetes bacterium]|nr:hypothetical protein [Bacteroidota bacterium]